MSDLNRDYILAVLGNKVDQVKFYLHIGADINAKEDEIDNFPALILAVQNGFMEVAKVLLDAGVDPNTVDYHGRTALMFAVLWRRDKEMVKLLIDAGADVNAQDADKRTAIIFASMYPPKGKSPDIVKLLLNAGADVSAEDKHGLSPIMYARISKHKRIAKVLVRAMSNEKERNKEE